MWVYIKQHSLQDPSDKRIIVCDYLFKALCDGEERITSFAITKHLQKCFEKVPEGEQEQLRQQFMENLKRENGEDTDEDDE
jgi:upstream activation factor subunit UAF30